jgi:HEAT repeat protein
VDADADVRSQAAWALGELEDRRAVEGLMALSRTRTDGAQAGRLGVGGDPDPRRHRAREGSRRRR